MKKVTFTVLAISVAIGGLGLSSAVMASQRGQQMPSFADLDTNGDGVITQAEIDAIGAGKFAESDANGDGYIDADEMQANMEARREGRGAKGGHGGEGDKGPRAGQGNAEMMQTQQGERMALAVKHMIERADTNGDGKLSADEMRPPKAGNMFERVDTDGNDEISQDEWDAAKASRGNGGGERGGNRGNHNN